VRINIIARPHTLNSEGSVEPVDLVVPRSMLSSSYSISSGRRLHSELICLFVTVEKFSQVVSDTVFYHSESCEFAEQVTGIRSDSFAALTCLRADDTVGVRMLTSKFGIKSNMNK